MQYWGTSETYLESINVAETVLDVRIDDQLGQAKDLTAEMKGVAESRFLPLLCGQRFDRLQIEVVVKVEIVERLSMNQKVEHVVALSTNLGRIDIKRSFKNIHKCVYKR